MFFPTHYQERIKFFTFVGMAAAFLLYSAFVYRADVPAIETAFAGPQVQAGKMLWQQHNCSSCHQLYGLGGYLGPDVTNTLSAKGKGRDYARAILKSGTGIMPNFHLSDAETEQLLAFLEHVDKSGRGSVHDYSPQPDGTITPKPNRHE